MKRLLSLIAVSLLTTSLFAEGHVEYKDGVETAREVSYLSQFVAALEATGLDETLRQVGPFTILAPTNEAFSRLPEGLLDVLFRRLPVLRQVLLHHIISGNIRARQFAMEPDAIARLTDANIVEDDIDTNNGVMHVVDTVLIPGSVDVGTLLLPDIIDVIQADGRFSILVEAIEAADLVERLRGEGPFTLFAPTDDSFDSVPAGSITEALGDASMVRDMVLRHVVPALVMATEVAAMTDVTTILGDSIRVRVDTGSIYIDRAQVVITDVQAGNGVIHVIDGVILPAEGRDM